MSERSLHVAVFASGRGSNFESILEAVDRGDAELKVVLCVSDREGAGALALARERGIPATWLNPTMYDDPGAYVNDLLAVLARHGTHVIALAGYLRKIPSEVVTAYRGLILNVHPALLPAFGGKGMYGRRVHEAVVEYGVRWTGATVHVVDEEYDTGPIVLQEPVPVYPDDTPDDVAARVLAVEHRIYPLALKLLAQGRIRIEGRRVRILDPVVPPSADTERAT